METGLLPFRAGLFTALVKRDGRWVVSAGSKRFPGSTARAHRDELSKIFIRPVSEAIAMNRAAAVAEVVGEFEEVRINL